MEVHSHGLDTLGVNKEADKVYNPELKDITSQIPAGENFTVLPSANPPDVHLNNDGAKNVDINSNAVPSAAFSFPPATSDLNSAPDIDIQPLDSVGVGQDLEHEVPQVGEQDLVFDDMVILENDMVTSASLLGGPSEIDQFQVSHIHVEGLDQPPIPDSYSCPSIAPNVAVVEVNVGEVTEQPSGVQLADSVTVITDTTVVMEATFVMEATQVIESDVGLPSSEGDGLPAVPTSDGLEAKVLDGTDAAGTVNLAAGDVDTAQKNELGGGNQEVTSEEIQEIKGQKVVKKFGRKNYGGEVVDFDPETKWFKVVYEDGDDEDLELSEVKEILESARKKRARAEGDDVDASSQKTSKKSRKTGSQSTAKKSKSAAKSPKTPGTKAEGLKSAKKFSSSQKPKSPGKLIKKALNSSAFKTPTKSQVKEGKGKGKAGTLTPKSTKGRSAKKIKSPKVSRSLSLQSPKSQKRGNDKATAESSTLKRGAKSSGVKRKADKGETSLANSKRSKKAVFEEGGDTDLIGKQVKKDFDGTFYDGVVVKFDKKTQFYKVKYADGDQEDLELHELEPILVEDLANTDAKDDKPAKLSSLSSLMSAEK